MRIGIDPGISGALFFLADEGDWLTVHDMPIMAKSSGKGNQINPYELHGIIEGETRGYKPTAYLERVNAMPGQGVSSVFSFGKSAGIIEGVLAAMGIKVVMVTPNKWKKAAGLTGKDKDAARTLAIQLYPDLANQLSRKKDVGRADAILIAHFGA